jgi:hypothetical protein
VALRDDALALSEVLRLISEGLERFRADSRSAYTRALAKQIAPIAAAFDRAVRVERSRELASDALASIAPLIAEANTALTKGELAFVQSSVMDRYLQLRTIFREQRYRHEML